MPLARFRFADMTLSTTDELSNLEHLVSTHTDRWPAEAIDLARVYALVAGEATDWEPWLDEASGIHSSSTTRRNRSAPNVTAKQTELTLCGLPEDADAVGIARVLVTMLEPRSIRVRVLQSESSFVTFRETRHPSHAVAS